MVTIRIGTKERSLQESDPNWLTQQVRRRREDGATVCVMVTVHEPGINVILKTPDCNRGFGGGRPPNPREKDIVTLGEKLHLNRSDFTGGNLVAFVKQLERLL